MSMLVFFDRKRGDIAAFSFIVSTACDPVTLALCFMGIYV